VPTTADSAWVFGYGSLIFKADFPYLARQPAHIMGWQRRFWQGSHDHRGTPEAPGRVVTLLPGDGEHKCAGMAYLIERDVFEHLDYREKNGYLRFEAELHLRGGDQVVGTVYIATESNHAFLGPAPESEIARHISEARGPSGANRDYLLDLATALRELQVEDEHVFELERLVLEL
jgi:cation transport protein ChaC